MNAIYTNENGYDYKLDDTTDPNRVVLVVFAFMGCTGNTVPVAFIAEDGDVAFFNAFQGQIKAHLWASEMHMIQNSIANMNLDSNNSVNLGSHEIPVSLFMAVWDAMLAFTGVF